MNFGRIFDFGGLSSTARLYIAYKFFGALYFTYPIFYEFASHTLNPMQIGMFFSAIGIFSFLLDIPSGVMADHWSRKRSALIGAATLALAPLVVLSDHGFAGYLVAAFLYGAGRAFLSGTLESLIYDHHSVTKEVYRRINALEITFGQAGILVSAACGGFLFAHSHRLPFIIEAITGMLTLSLICFMQEHYKPDYIKPVGSHRKHLLQSMSHMFATQYLRVTVLMGTTFSVMLGICIQFVNESTMIEHGFQATTRGLLVSGGGIATLLILNLFLLRLLHDDSRRVMYLSVGAFVAYALMGTVFTVTFLVGYLFWCCLNATSSFIRVMLQDHIPSSHRATVLSSFKSLAVLIGMAGSTATGWLVQSAHTPRAAYMLFSVLSAGIIVPCALWLVAHELKQRAHIFALYSVSSSQNR